MDRKPCCIALYYKKLLKHVQMLYLEVVFLQKQKLVYIAAISIFIMQI